ncbi:ATP-binding protein [Embleya scabrispora]|nr:ATP-binding protein [Embleya scabrispora]
MTIVLLLLVAGALVVALQQGRRTLAGVTRHDLPERLSARYLDDCVLLTDTDAWTWMELPTLSVDFLTPDEVDAVIENFSTALAGLRDTTIHLKVVHRPNQLHEWAGALYRRAEATGHAAPGLSSLLLAEQQHLYELDTHTKRVFLGVRLGERGRSNTGWLRTSVRPLLGFLRTAEELLASVDHTVPTAEIRRWTSAADAIRRTLAAGALSARPADQETVAGLFVHALHPEMPTPNGPDVPAQPFGPGTVEQLGEGYVDATHSRYVVVTQPNADYAVQCAEWRQDGEVGPAPEREFVTYVASVSVGRFPRAIDTTAQPPWLELADSAALAFNVDVSARWTITPPHKAAKDVAKRLQAAADQQKHYAEAGAVASVENSDALVSAVDLDAEISRNRTPLVYGAARMIVSGYTPEELTERIGQLRELYRTYAGIELHWTDHDQLSLWLEQLPGERVRSKVRAYRQIHELRTVAAGLPTASSRISDTQGPYLGLTTRGSGEVVLFDPLFAPQHNKPPGVAIIGSPGGGKTFTANTITFKTAMRGVTSVLIDPKGDAKGLSLLGRDYLGDVRMLELGANLPGLLDPFGMAESREEQTLLAIETLKLLLGGEMADVRESVMMASVKAVAHAPQPTLRKVLDLLLSGDLERMGLNESPEAHYGAAANALGHYLDVVSALPLGILCFSPDTTEIKLTRGRLTIITLAGLSLPPAGTDPDRYTYEQRLSLTLMYLVTHFARRALGLHDIHRTDPRMLVIDEAWMITQTQQGAQLVEAVARMGRSRNTALVLVSQNGRDLLDEAVLNCLSTVFVFRASDPGEIAADLELLGLADTEANRARVLQLPVGRHSEALMRDSDGRVGQVRIDLSHMPDVVLAFDSTPTERDGPTQAAARRIATDRSGRVLAVDGEEGT